MKIVPSYQHDCDCCRFLGVYKGHDLYHCEDQDTFIARYSDDGPDYISTRRQFLVQFAHLRPTDPVSVAYLLGS